MSKTDKTSEWASTTVAIAELGISRGHLINLKDDGTLRLVNIGEISVAQMQPEPLTDGTCPVFTKY
jgi:hypothetical protein